MNAAAETYPREVNGLHPFRVTCKRSVHARTTWGGIRYAETLDTAIASAQAMCAEERAILVSVTPA